MVLLLLHPLTSPVPVRHRHIALHSLFLVTAISDVFLLCTFFRCHSLPFVALCRVATSFDVCGTQKPISYRNIANYYNRNGNDDDDGDGDFTIFYAMALMMYLFSIKRLRANR